MSPFQVLAEFPRIASAITYSQWHPRWPIDDGDIREMIRRHRRIRDGDERIDPCLFQRTWTTGLDGYHHSRLGFPERAKVVVGDRPCDFKMAMTIA